MQAETLGVWYGADKLEPAQWIDFVTTVERLGYDTQWYSEAMGFESMAFGSFLLANTQRLKIGSSIANIYARDAVASRNGLKTLGRISNDRYVLGLGVSHVPLVERFRGHTYGKPVAAMRHYLEQMRAEQPDADTWPVVIAALGPRMLELAAELTQGAIPYNVTPEHTAQARSILGPDKWLAVEQKFCLESDHRQGAGTGAYRIVALHGAAQLHQQLAAPRLQRIRPAGRQQRPLPERHGRVGRRGRRPRPRPGALRRRRHAGLPPTRPSPRRPRRRQGDAHRTGAVANLTRYA